MISTQNDASKFKQAEVIEDFTNKVLYSKCHKLSATVTNIAKLANLIANTCIEKLYQHTTHKSDSKVVEMPQTDELESQLINASRDHLLA